ncbi:MAG TPA: efflux transporter outer membrane subunit [Caulobacteraceae bacterium]|jgi:NodT family efflux transporter outer membrane factor (OMF) lipoprotein
MQIFRRFLGPGFVASLLAGCVGGHPRAPDLSLLRAYEAPASRPQLTTEQLDRWWLIFNDPALTALEDEALRTAPDAKTAYSRLVEAGATRSSLIAGTFPTGNAGGNISKQHEVNIGPSANTLFPIGGDFITRSGSLNVSWELDVFGRLAVQRKIARANFVATEFDVEGAFASLAANVASDYFQATGLQIQIEDAQETVRIETNLARIAQEKADRGLGALSDADRVAGDLSQALATLTDLESQLHATRRNLLILIGRNAAATETIPVRDHADEAPDVPAAVPGDLLQRRPDIREAEARLRSEAGTDRLSHLALFPTFTMLPALGAQSPTQPSVGFIPPATLIPESITTSVGYWTLAGSVSQPVLDIPRLLFDAKSEDARMEQAVIAYEKTVQTAYGEAENALVALDAGKRAVKILFDGEARAHRAYDAAQRRYAMGLDDLTTALTTEQAWRTTRAALTAEQTLALQRAVTTYKALGGGWPAQVAQVETVKNP